MLPSRRGFRAALGVLALSALLGAPPAAQAATRHGSPAAMPASSFWQQAIAGLEARIAGVLRLVRWGGSSPDQSPGQDPNG